MAAPALTTYYQGLGQVSADGLNTMEQTCDTFAQLRTLVGLPGMQVFARGGLSIADGLQGVFYWQANNAGPDNGSTVIVPTGALLGAWVKLALVTNSAFPLGQGRLVFNSTTQVQFNPYNGNSIQIAGGVFQIPAAGITAANTGVFINGASNQNLIASTLYYVYLFSNAGTPTIDFSTTAYAQDTTAGNIGVFIKNSTPSRSLIGMVFVDASAHFNDTLVLRNVASWFNRQPKPWSGGTATSATGSATLVELNTSARIEGVTWADSLPLVGMAGSALINTQFATAEYNIGRDGAVTTVFSQNIALTAPQANTSGPITGTGGDNPSEGHHFWTPLAKVDGGGSNNTTPSFGLVGMVWS